MAEKTSDSYTVTFDDEGHTYVDGQRIDDLTTYLHNLHNRHMINTQLIAVHTALCSGCEGDTSLCGYFDGDELTPEEEQRVRKVANRIAVFGGSMHAPEHKQLEIAASKLAEWSKIING